MCFSNIQLIPKWLFLRNKNTHNQINIIKILHKKYYLKCIFILFFLSEIIYLYIYLIIKKIDTAFRYDVPVQKSYIATKLSLACVQPSSITSSSSFPMAMKHLWFLIWGNMSLFAVVAISLRKNPQATFQPVLLLWISQGLVGSWESKRIKKKKL